MISFSSKIARLAVSLLNAKHDDVIVEIGPGHGELTKFIPDCNLILIEKDEALLKEIKIKSAKKIHGDGVENIKRRDFDCLISSVPYAICEPLIRELFLHNFKKAVLILPENFTKRLENNETSLSFLAKELLDIKTIMKIGREKFEPSPRVDSLLVEIKRRKGNALIEKMCLQLTKKTKNALAEAFADVNGLTKKEARAAVEKMGISKRALEKTVRMLSYHELKYIKDTTK